MLIGRNEFDSLENTGAIKVKATADSSEDADIEAIGIIVERSIIANGFENSGTIEVVASAEGLLIALRELMPLVLICTRLFSQVISLIQDR